MALKLDDTGWWRAVFTLADSMDAAPSVLPYRARMVLRETPEMDPSDPAVVWIVEAIESQCASCFGAGVVEADLRPCDTCGGGGWGAISGEAHRI